MTYCRKLTICILFSAAAVSAAFIYFHIRHEQRSSIEDPIKSSATEPLQSLPNSTFPAIHVRRVYPYSVIPGGISNVAELRENLKNDPQLAIHLRDFDLNKAVLVKTASPQAMYVSYRVGNRIFWTARKLTIARGEVLISDGKHTIRGRCGNDISAVPMKPISPSAEPTSVEFDAPVLAPEITLTPSSFPFSGPLVPPLIAPPVTASSPGDYTFVPPVFWGPGGGGPAAPVPTSVPEPPTFLLLSLGGTAAGLRALWAKRESQKSAKFSAPIDHAL